MLLIGFTGTLLQAQRDLWAGRRFSDTSRVVRFLWILGFRLEEAEALLSVGFVQQHCAGMHGLKWSGAEQPFSLLLPRRIFFFRIQGSGLGFYESMILRYRWGLCFRFLQKCFFPTQEPSTCSRHYPKHPKP